MRPRGPTLSWLVLASIAIGLASSSAARADTFTLHASLDPTTRRHTVNKFGEAVETFDCRYGPVDVTLAAGDTLAISVEVLGGGFLATTRPGVYLEATLYDTGQPGTCEPTFSSLRVDPPDFTLLGELVPSPTSTFDYYAPSDLLFFGETAESTSPFRVSSVVFSRPMLDASTTTRETCGCQWTFQATDDDRPLVWGPSVPRIGTVLANTAQPSVAQCPFGGVLILRGHDDGYGGAAAGDGVLDSREVEETDVICAGANGGHATLVTTDPAGILCSKTGGVLVESGADDGASGGIADDGILEPGEIRTTRVVCSGAPGCSVTSAGRSAPPSACFALASAWLATFAARRRRVGRAQRARRSIGA